MIGYRPDGEVRWTFTRLRDEIAVAARAAIAHGVRPGDRVAIWAPTAASGSRPHSAQRAKMYGPLP
ncbi:hypothetical protein NLX86_03785 [Streptomyces sp. A3M-1-3]|uniref:hypothetical protein n=1 Tax=Streptomyces sp. A3M-1-3 TaxID=2962044 RepID=UPI0020B69DAF|nr:hypothetical protein [Streptomyces sp. A3M-1-3]MCP3817289.1 hypothetical protein [Streptomyces sp. A3M-1-3]